jgi:two-component system, OmpR family, sensor histidine kinase MprB
MTAVSASRISGRLGQMSFRQRLIMLSAAAVAAAVLLASAIVFVVVRGELRGQVDHQLRDLVEQIAIPTQLGVFTQETGVFILPSAPLGGSGGYAQIVQPDGTVLRPKGREVEVPVTRRTLEVAGGERQAFLEDKTIDGVHARVFTAHVSGGVAIQAVRSLEEVDSTLRDLALALALICIFGIALAVWLGRMVARTALTPVSELTDAAEHVAETRDLSRRMQTTGGDELSRLGSSFNTMLEALDDSQRAQQQLVEDASHELRTPLTSLRTNIEVLTNADALPPDDRRRLLGDVVRQLDELTALVAGLVDLARGEEPEDAADEVRLDRLVTEAVDRARIHAPDKMFSVELEPCIVHGVAARLDRAVSNLLDNASKWSSPGGTVELTLRDGELSVRDHGPGIEPNDIPHIFDRFYRASAARRLPGSGLGLAIVRQVAESHGGEVSAQAADGGGARLVLRLPTVRTPPPASERDQSLWSKRRSAPDHADRE